MDDFLNMVQHFSSAQQWSCGWYILHRHCAGDVATLEAHYQTWRWRKSWLGNKNISNNVNPGLINPKRAFNWKDTIEVYHRTTCDCFSPSLIKDFWGSEKNRNMSLSRMVQICTYNYIDILDYVCPVSRCPTVLSFWGLLFKYIHIQVIFIYPACG